MFGLKRAIDGAVKGGVNDAMPSLVRTFWDEIVAALAKDLRENGNLPQELHAALKDYLAKMHWRIVSETETGAEGSDG